MSEWATRPEALRPYWVMAWHLPFRKRLFLRDPGPPRRHTPFNRRCLRCLHAPIDIAQEKLIYSYAMPKEQADGRDRSEVLQGTLDLMILKTLQALGPLHGFGIARRIEHVSDEVLQLNEGTVYTSLLRLQQQGWIASEWGTSENNRRARFYSITRAGRKQLDRETKNWERISGVIARVLALGERS
jgi:PadR family transcriptional regulator, regulatory protein PadR